MKTVYVELVEKLERWAKQRDLEQKIGEHGGPENAGRTHRTCLLREAAAALTQFRAAFGWRNDTPPKIASDVPNRLRLVARTPKDQIANFWPSNDSQVLLEAADFIEAVVAMATEP